MRQTEAQTLTIWKYEIPIEDRFEIEMPWTAKVLTVQVQQGRPCIWALVDPTQAKQNRSFWLFGTGHHIDFAGSYIGTFQIASGNLVFHLFEEAR